MKKLTSLFLFFSLNLFGQTNRINIYISPVRFTSKGDSWGTCFGFSHEYSKKRMSIESGFQIFQTIKTTNHYYNLESDPSKFIAQEFRTGFFTNTLYVVPKIKANLKKLNFNLGIGPAFSLEHNSAPSNGYTVIFPYITKLPDPIFVLKYPGPSKEFNVGYLGKINIEYSISKKLNLSISAFLQQNSRNIYYGLPLGLSVKI